MAQKKENQVIFGLENVHYSVITHGEDGAIQYAKPVHVPGAVTLTTTVQSSETTFYADNTAYYVDGKNNGYTGTLEMAYFPESFYVDVLGDEKDTNGVIFEKSDARPKEFALLYEISGDPDKSRTTFYRCVVTARPDAGSETTQDTNNPRTRSLSISMVPRANDKIVKAVTESESASYATWFDKVYEKPAEPGA